MVCAPGLAMTLLLFGYLACIKGYLEYSTMELVGEETHMCQYHFRPHSPRIIYRFPTEWKSEACEHQCTASKFEKWEERMASAIVSETKDQMCHCKAKGGEIPGNYLIPFSASVGCSPMDCWKVFVRVVDILKLVEAEEEVGTLNSYDTSCQTCAGGSCESSLDVDLGGVLKGLEMVQNSTQKVAELKAIGVDVSKVGQEIQQTTNYIAEEDATEDSNSEDVNGTKQNTILPSERLEAISNEPTDSALDPENVEGMKQNTTTDANVVVSSLPPEKQKKQKQSGPFNRKLTPETWKFTECRNVRIQEADTPWSNCPREKLWWCADSAAPVGDQNKKGYCICMRKENFKATEIESLKEQAATEVKNARGGGAPRASWCHRVPVDQVEQYELKFRLAKNIAQKKPSKKASKRPEAKKMPNVTR